MACPSLTACATAERLKIVDSACLSFSPLTYANAKAGQEHDDDTGNRYDTAQTVTDVAAFNASWRELCEQEKGPRN